MDRIRVGSPALVSDVVQASSRTRWPPGNDVRVYAYVGRQQSLHVLRCEFDNLVIIGSDRTKDVPTFPWPKWPRDVRTRILVSTSSFCLNSSQSVGRNHGAGGM